MKKVYFAGPDVFRADAKDFFQYVNAICIARGMVPLIPLDNDAPLSDSGPEMARAIFQANLKMIRECDVVVANITPFRGVSVDAGTAFEIGYATALGKPVVGYTSEDRTYKLRVPNPAPSHPVVEDFGLIDNLMVVCATDGVWRSLESAILWSLKC